MYITACNFTFLICSFCTCQFMHNLKKKKHINETCGIWDSSLNVITLLNYAVKFDVDLRNRYFAFGSTDNFCIKIFQIHKKVIIITIKLEREKRTKSGSEKRKKATAKVAARPKAWIVMYIKWAQWCAQWCKHTAKPFAMWRALMMIMICDCYSLSLSWFPFSFPFADDCKCIFLFTCHCVIRQNRQCEVIK